MVLIDIHSGAEKFQAEIIRSNLPADRSIIIRVAHSTGCLETMVVAYPSTKPSAMTLVNTRPDDLEMTARNLASRLANKLYCPILLALEIVSSQNCEGLLWARYIKDIENSLLVSLTSG